MTTRSYLRSRKANPVLSSNIISFLDARSKFHLLHNERSLLSHLPTHLKEEIMFVKHFSTLKKIPIFNFIENRSVVIHLYNLFTVSYYAKNEYIFREGINS